MERVESEGSIWMFDEALKVYMRMPKEEQPRPPQFQVGGRLEDFTWIPYESFDILPAHERNGEYRPPGLYITYADDDRRAYAPLPTQGEQHGWQDERSSR